MAKYLNRQSDDDEDDAATPASQEDQIYDLKGVLLHKGTSAHHGHYVAQVYDIKFASNLFVSCSCADFRFVVKGNGLSATTNQLSQMRI